MPDDRDGSAVMNGALIAAAGGAFLLVVGVLVRTGVLRQNVNAMQSSNSPFWMRNGPFALVPLGLALLSGAAAAALEARRGTQGGVADTSLVVAAVILALIAAIVILKPPGIAKPSWLRDPDAEVGKPIEVGPIRFFAPWVVALGVAVTFFATGRPLAGIVGLGVGVAAAAGVSRRLRRRRTASRSAPGIST